MYLRGELAGLYNHVLGFNPDYLASLPSRLGALWNFFKDLRPGISFDVFAMKDPMPGVLGFIQIVSEYCQRIGSAIGRRVNLKSKKSDH